MKFALPSLLIAALAGCARAPGDDVQAPPAPTDASAEFELGRRVYNFRCYFCHGYSGDARTLASTYLSPPPRDFSAAAPDTLTPAAIARVLHDGRPGTAMKPFAQVLSAAEIRAVSVFVAEAFVRDKARNTAYHTAENGWPEHERFAIAFPFAAGTVALDTAWEDLTPELAAGKRLFLDSCISCHDRAKVDDEGPAWTTRPVSYPRAGFVFDPDASVPVDALSGASVYAKHDVAPALSAPAAPVARGKALFEANCAFCHGADGSGSNWIGRFMEPPARDLRQFSAQTLPRPLLVATIRDGLTETSMPAWKDVLTTDEIDAIADYVSRAIFRTGSAAVVADGGDSKNATRR